MKATDIDFRKLLEFSPETGRLLLGADRMLIFRQEAFSSLRKLLIEQLGDKLARGLLAQFGYRCGMGDYKALASQFPWDSELDEFGAGPTMHMWEGIVHVTLKTLEFDRKAGHLHIIGEWRNSYEAENHLAAFGKSDTPVCHTLTGYASGHTSTFLGARCICIETTCVGKGDSHCTAEIRPLAAWGREADPWKAALELTDTSLSREFERKLRELEQYRANMELLSTPIIQVWKDVVVLPVIGSVDTERGEHMTAKLVRRVADEGVRCVLVDLTGASTIDTRAAALLVRMTRAVSLLGARCIITGVRPEVAQALIAMDVDLGGLKIVRSLQQGLEESLRLLGYSVTHCAPSTF